MEWVYRSLMALSVIFGGLVSAHVFPAEYAAITVAIAAAAGFFSTRSGVPPNYVDVDVTSTFSTNEQQPKKVNGGNGP